ncbi:hypothetical protein EK21DRAFT_105032 [Setomelanomma holmii]|uniref:Uncharacterized protein n=1 Tax=Setomelanomma holmii TaxID=210430 RepID=A0A9P4GYP4_9PLEO|nr:hypothetical protein EK21DRAFT_105032 [Setomelanomma holmii]
MGGHAFKYLRCPRFSPDIYADVKTRATLALKTIFSHVVVPTEMPAKEDYGDIDFLVCGPRHSLSTTNIDDFDWSGTVAAIKSVFNTSHGRRGFLNVDCMYFAIQAIGDEYDFWIQIDVKVCFKSELFEWQTFETSYASNSKMIGSMIKPLGLTIDPRGMHIRVEEIEVTNGPGSMVWITKDPRDVLQVVGLDRRILHAGFFTKDEVYEYLTSSWLFNPAHFGARLAETEYYERLGDQSPHWTYFIKEWIPKHYPGYMLKKKSTSRGPNQEQQLGELNEWYKHTRATVREKVFTMFPHIATTYFIKRAAYMTEQEEQRLRTVINAAIPAGNDGWRYDFARPEIIVRHEGSHQSTPVLKSTAVGELTPPITPTQEVQCHVNYMGMWKKRFEKEHQKVEKKRLEEEVKLKAEEMAMQNRAKTMSRLISLNKSLGLFDGGRKTS